MKLVLLIIFFSIQLYAEEQLVTFEQTVQATRPKLLDGSPTEKKISENDFSLLKPQSLNDIFKMSSEFAVSDPYAGTVGVFLRGADSEKVLVLIDGVVVNDPTAPTGGFDFRFIQPSEIEEIKVWSPSESIVWGPGAIGGIISIKTKKKNKAYLYTSLACHKTLQLNSGVPFEANGWNHYFSGSLFQTEGITSASTNTGASELDGAKKYNFRLSSQKTFESHQFQFQTLQSQGWQDTDNSAPSDDPNSAANFQHWLIQVQDVWRPNLNTEMTFSASLRRIGRNEFNDPDTVSASYNYSKELGSEETLRFQYLRKVESGSAIDAGLDYNHILANFDSRTSTPSTETVQQEDSKFGAFLRLHYQLNKSKFIPGIRYQQSFAGANLLSSFRYLQEFQNNLNFEAQLTSSTKDPTIYQKYSTTYGYAQLNSEKSDVLQLGFSKIEQGQKISFLHFYQWYKDLIQYNLTLSKYRNEASAHVYGIQLDYEKIMGSVTLKTGWTELFAFNGSHDFLLRRPRQTFTLGTEHIYKKFRFMPQILWKGLREDSSSGTKVYLPSYLNIDFGWIYFYKDQLYIEGAFRNILGQELVEAYNYSGLGRRAEFGLRMLW